MLSTQRTARASWDDYGVLLVVSDLAEAPALANRLAAEHVELAIDEPEAMFAQIRDAGSVFLGRFFGPLRSIVPLVAGLCGMPQLSFQLANIASALVWATGVLAPGSFGLRWLL